VVGSSATVLLHIFPDSGSEITLKIGQYLVKLRRRKKWCQIFWATLYGRLCMRGLTENDGHENDGPSNLQGIKFQNLATLNTVALIIHAVALM